jgi:preprotein translocase subunit SecY
MGALKYVIIGVVIAVVVVIALVYLLQTQHRVPVQYVGSPGGYEAFVPNNQTIEYNGNIDPIGDLILDNG